MADIVPPYPIDVDPNSFERIDWFNKTTYAINNPEINPGVPSFWLISDAASIKRDTGGAYVPATVTFTAQTKDNLNPPGPYNGRFIISTSDDGISYTTRYTSASDESTKTYTPPVGIAILRCRLYYAGGTSDLIDEDVIPIVEDGTSSAVTPDTTPPPTPSSLTVTAGLNQIVVSWSGTGYTEGHGHSQTIIYGLHQAPGTTPLPTIADASIIEVVASPGTIISIPSNLNRRWHIWAKFQTNDGYLSTTAAGGTNGTQATTGKVGNSDLNDLIIEQQNIVNNAITSVKIDTNAVTAGKIAANAIVAGDGVIGNLAVTNAMVAADISADKLTAGTLAAARIAAGSLNADKIVAGTIGADRMVTNLLSADNVLTRNMTVRDNSGNIIFSSGVPLDNSRITPSNAWLNAQISLNSNGTINNAGGGAVTVAGLDNSIIRSGNPITAGNISTYMASAAIGSAYIASLNADVITAGTLNVDRIFTNSINTTKLAPGAISASYDSESSSGYYTLPNSSASATTSTWTLGDITTSAATDGVGRFHTTLNIRVAGNASATAGVRVTIHILENGVDVRGWEMFWRCSDYIDSIFGGRANVVSNVVSVELPYRSYAASTTYTYTMYATVAWFDSVGAAANPWQSARTPYILINCNSNLQELKR